MSIKNLLLIVTGSISACKVPSLISLLKKDFNITSLITANGKKFITQLTLSSLTGNPSYEDLFSLKDEVEMGHIQLSRIADLILVAPASCNIIASMALGFASDLASTVLLANNNKPVFIAPSMNISMWTNPATKRNINTLINDGIKIIGPEHGELACGEVGYGRMTEPVDIVKYLYEHL